MMALIAKQRPYRGMAVKFCLHGCLDRNEDIHVLNRLHACDLAFLVEINPISWLLRVQRPLRCAQSVSEGRIVGNRRLCLIESFPVDSVRNGSMRI
jgi:hypothetical protein